MPSAIHSQSSGETETQLLRILHDTDLLDGLGALWIARAFVSKSHLPLYDPCAPFEDRAERWPARYCSDPLVSQMDWYRRLNTTTARAMAQDRLALMKRFIA